MAPVMKMQILVLAIIALICGYLTSSNHIISPITTIIKQTDETKNNPTTRKTGKREKPYSKAVIYYADDNVVQILTNKELPSIIRKKKDKSNDNYIILNNDDEAIFNDDVNCKPTHSWHEGSFEQCNILHELDLSQTAIDGTFKHLASGYDRSVFKIRTKFGDDVAFKILKLEREVKDLEYYQAEGMIMATTNSPYILQSYSYCSISNIIELGSGGHLQQRRDYTRETGIDTIKSIDKLKIAIQMSTALADLHDSGVTHNDLYLSQYVDVDGIYKLTDFHMATFLTKHNSTGKVCPDAIEFWQEEAYIHAPELKLKKKDKFSIKSGDYDYATGDSAKSDDYMLGNDLYGLLTNLRLFEKTSFKRKHKDKTSMIKDGKRSKIPEYITKKSEDDPAIQAIINAINMAWIHYPSNRKTARQISNYLKEKLKEIEGKKNKIKSNNNDNDDGIIRISISDLPKDFEFPENDDAIQ